jgi:hypothetical protein
MKRILSVLISLTLLISLSACDASVKDTTASTATSSSATSTSAQTSSETTETTPAKVTVNIYLPNENVDGFEIETREFDGTYTGLIDVLVEAGAIPEGTTARYFVLDEGYATAYLNLSEEFLTGLNAAGTTGEHMIIGSLVNTFLGYYKLNNITLAVNGQSFETGHTIYNEPLDFVE